MDSLLKTIINHYLNSSEYNGIPIYSITGLDIHEVKTQIKRGLVEAIYNDLNPHIKFFNIAESTDTQIEFLQNSDCCLYPTPFALAGYPKDQRKKYSVLLQSGWGQFEIIFFNVAVLEVYFNNPQYLITDMGYRGQINVLDEYADDDDLELIRDFGVAYGPEKNDRAIGVFVRDLAYLSEKSQMRWASYELDDQAEWQINGNFVGNMLFGRWTDNVWVFDALLEEQTIINRMCECIGIHHIFSKTWNIHNYERPEGYRLILIPTWKNYYDFVNVLEKIVANNISSKAFTAHQNKTKAIISEENEGTISLLGRWLKENGRNAEAVDESIVGPLKTIRNTRQTPAHKFVENKYDKSVYEQQNHIVEKAYEATSCLRIMLGTHPLAQNVDIPEYLKHQKGIVFY